MADKSQFKLSADERREAFAGTLNVLRRPHKPDLEAGADVVVSTTRGGRQVIDRDTGKTIEVEPIPRLWITIKGFHLRAGQTEWETDVQIHDHREKHRVLANGIGGMPREAGLKTRSGTRVIHSAGEVQVVDKRVPRRGEQRENWTPETERGYGGAQELERCDYTGRLVEAIAVDDETLAEFAAASKELSEAQRKVRRGEDKVRARRREELEARDHGKADTVIAAKRRQVEEAEKQLISLCREVEALEGDRGLAAA